MDAAVALHAGELRNCRASTRSAVVRPVVSAFGPYCRRSACDVGRGQPARRAVQQVEQVLRGHPRHRLFLHPASPSPIRPFLPGDAHARPSGYPPGHGRPRHRSCLHRSARPAPRRRIAPLCDPAGVTEAGRIAQRQPCSAPRRACGTHPASHRPAACVRDAGAGGQACRSFIWIRAPCQVWYQTCPVKPLTESIPVTLPPRRICTV